MPGEYYMRKYCIAYSLKEVRQFSGWIEKQNEQEALHADDIVYLWDDFTVVRSPVIPERGLLFDQVTPEWQHFCRETLKFTIPEDLYYAYQQTDSSNTVIVE